MISTNFQTCTEIENSSLKLTRIQMRKDNNFVVPLCRFYYTAASCVGNNLNILPRSPCAACACIKMSAMKHTVHHVYLHEYTQYEHGILHIFTSSSDGEMPVPWQEPEIPVVLLPSVGSAYEQECQLPAFVRPSIGLSAGSYPCDPAVFLGGGGT